MGIREHSRRRNFASIIPFRGLEDCRYCTSPERRCTKDWPARTPMDLRILIVDDSATMRHITATIVGSQPGWTVCGEAEDGLSGIQKFQELKPDLVLLDFGMPGINGIETASWMSIANPTVPIILFTVWESEGLARAAAKAGIYALVRKSEAWTLLARIESAFAQKYKKYKEIVQ